MTRTVLITGGGRGIGRATALLAADGGYRVCITYLQDQQAADQVVEDIQHRGGEAMAFQSDVSDEKAVLKLFSDLDHEVGPITHLVNNAGILERQMRVEDMDALRLQRIFATNVIGPFLCAREAIRRMSTKQGGTGGAIVNVSSRAAVLGSPSEYVDYAASKGALDTFTVGLSREVAAEGIRVNGVRPGIIHTDIHAAGGEPGRVERVQGSVPMLRGGHPEEVARAILWLLSDEASYVTGTLLDVGGGR